MKKGMRIKNADQINYCTEHYNEILLYVICTENILFWTDNTNAILYMFHL